jgi:hypothetical protein
MIAAAILLGVLGDLVLRAGPWGLNFPVWTAAFSLSLVAVARTLPGGHRVRPLTALPVIFAALLAWRDSPFLVAWDFLATMAAFGLIAIEAMEIRLRAARLLHYVAAALKTGCNVAFGPLLLASSDLTWRQVTGQTSARRATSALVGVTLATPLVLIFGGLLTSADPVFDGLVRTAFDWDFASITSHLLLIGIITWLVAGYLRALTFGSTPKLPDRSNGPTLGILELGIPLAALILVFLAFAAVQTRYLFGGEDVVLSATGLTYADYARRGFFELVAATALVLPVLLAAEWALDKHDVKTVRSFRVLAVVLLLLVALIMDSALTRMLLYVDAYGLTADRLYATVFMGWIGVVLIWFAVTTLFGDGRRFTFGAVATGLAILLGLNALNPDRLIAEVNIQRAQSGRAVDVVYLARLSADAVPHIVPRLAELEASDACEFLLRAEDRWTERSGDWRSWNLGRARAAGALSSDAAARSRRRCLLQPGPTL